MTTRRSSYTVFLALIALAACGAGKTPTAPACDAKCEDAVAVQALRDAIKLGYNLTLQGKPVGAQDAVTPCPLGGSAHVFGQATSNAAQGSTQVALTYAFVDCAFSQTDTDPTKTYQMTLSGTVTEEGTIAVQPSAATALVFHSDAMTFAGTVYATAIPYAVEACPLQLGQNGNLMAGTLCTRQVGLSL